MINFTKGNTVRAVWQPDVWYRMNKKREGGKIVFIKAEHRETIQRQGDLLQRYLDTMEALIKQDGSVKSPIEQAAIERILHICVEILIDSSNVLIDALIMRDPASYTDIIDIMEDEQVFTSEVAGVLKEAVDFRKILVHDYAGIQPDDLWSAAPRLFAAFLEARAMLYRYAGVTQ
ncbi:MAG: hypothetical protein JWN30_2804 [Bacilli bacterium]|nr:hypothetical protein [Bacilli bacterium]